MSYDLLHQVKPRRLTYRRGKWQLEVSQLVGRSGVYQPQRTYLESPNSILQFLEEHSSGALAADARELFKSPPTRDTSFEVAQGLWVAHGSMSEAPGRPSARPPENGAELLELRMELAGLKTLCSQLRAQLAALEGEVARLRSEGFVSAADEGAVRSLRKPPVSARGRSDSEQPVASRKPAASSPPVHRSQANAPSPAKAKTEGAAPPPETEQTEAAAPTEAGGPPSFKPLIMPSDDKLLKCISQLLDQPVAARALKNAPRTSSEPSQWYVAAVIDDHDVEVGAFACNLEAAIRLSALLLMIPEGAVQDQLRLKTLEQGALEAASEVFNTASSTLNEIAANTHCRTRVLMPLEASGISWLDHARSRLVLELESGGTLLLLGR